ncbi:MAG: MgtC/SapB family protein [Candidatus Omnitrophica bacterium]|nr:MgtC/SapB family protein [Candidatus Omnitrophota bacterium]
MDPDFWIKLLVAAVCGSIIGFERQLSGKPVGIRTSILVCLATMTFIDLSQSLDQETGTARVLGQIVTGVGFLGAGVIMAKEGLIIGVTSASVVWILAAVGSSIGLERYGTALATSVATVLVLTGVQRLEDTVSVFRKGVHRRRRPDQDEF